MFDMDALAAKVRAKREAINPALTVRFVREDGREDRFSFAEIGRADRFRAALVRQGRTVLS